LQVLDLSHAVEEGMPVFPGTPSININSMKSVYSDGYSELKLELYTHIGTHIDAPSHILKKAKSITDFNINQFIGKAFRLSYSNTEKISINFIESKIKRFGKPDFILFNSGWDRYWGTNRYFKDYPLPDTSVFYYLSQLQIKGIGFDTISIDKPDSRVCINHRLMLSSGTIIVENLTNLSKIKNEVFDFYCFPLNISNADGSPVRAAARF
jgi:kynurenine formamidase